MLAWGLASISIWSWSDRGKYSAIMRNQKHEWSQSHYANRPLYKQGLQLIPWYAMLQHQCYCQLLMPITAADTLILHTPGGGMGWESQAVAAAAASQREMSGETRWNTTDGSQSLTTLSHYTEMTRGVCTAPFFCSHSLTVTNRWMSAGSGIRASISH